jgi:hypothetical protein
LLRALSPQTQVELKIPLEGERSSKAQARHKVSRSSTYRIIDGQVGKIRIRLRQAVSVKEIGRQREGKVIAEDLILLFTF